MGFSLLLLIFLAVSHLPSPAPGLLRRFLTSVRDAGAALGGGKPGWPMEVASGLERLLSANQRLSIQVQQLGRDLQRVYERFKVSLCVVVVVCLCVYVCQQQLLEKGGKDSTPRAGVTRTSSWATVRVMREERSD